MIILQEECVPPEKEIEDVKRHYKQEKFIIDGDYYSSYYDQDNSDQYSNRVLVDFYSRKIEDAMKKFGLYHRTKYNWQMWIQIYNSTLGAHSEHDHFSGNGIISWVNFVKTPNQKCFYFLDSQNNKTYPNQNSGQIIFFPSWALHGVDKMESDGDRIVIAGNIYLNEIFSNNQLLVSSRDETFWTWKVLN